MLEGPVTLKELELSMRDLNTTWFMGSKTDLRWWMINTGTIFHKKNIQYTINLQ
jgi:hypothetical protein